VTSANLELVRSLYPAWARGEWQSVDWAHPQIEFVAADGPDQGRRARGVENLGNAWRDFLEPWQEWRVEPEEYRELDDERVLVLVKLGGRGKSSGLEVEHVHAHGANLFHIREGKVTRLVLYWNRENALADVR
jgi:ketosteroid isomerase-like protein